jgi:hypothetical protein
MDERFIAEVEDLLPLWHAADEFEDRLAELLGARRPAEFSYGEWRQFRVRHIEGSDPDRADELAAVVEDELRGRPVVRGAYSTG